MPHTTTLPSTVFSSYSLTLLDIGGDEAMSGSQGITNIFADIFHMTAGKKIVGTLSAVPIPLFKYIEKPTSSNKPKSVCFYSQ